MMQLLLLTAVLFWQPKSRPLQVPPIEKHMVWYLDENSEVVRCSGKPHLIVNKEGLLKLAVEGCLGPWPQRILHD